MGWAAQGTVRSAVDNLRAAQALSKASTGDSGNGVTTELTPAGNEMLLVADAIEVWLARFPDGEIHPDSEEARSAVKALAGGWSTTLTRALLHGPLTLSELHSHIPDINYPALERRVAWMRTTQQIEPVEKEGRGTPYVATDWLRYAMAPVSLAGRCELRHLEDAGVPVADIEIETWFLLTLPLVTLPDDASGSCMLASQTQGMEAIGGGEPRLAGAVVEVDRGRLASCEPGIARDPDTWAIGSMAGWLDAVVDGQIENLRVGGRRPQMALDLISGLHFALFADQ